MMYIVRTLLFLRDNKYAVMIKAARVGEMGKVRGEYICESVVIKTGKKACVGVADEKQVIQRVIIGKAT